MTTWNGRLEKGLITQGKYDDWYEQHEVACSVNTEASSLGMEAEAAVTLWNRSVDKNKLDYCTFIGDGDSKSSTDVLAAKPYGDVTVQKEGCTGHVQNVSGCA